MLPHGVNGLVGQQPLLASLQMQQGEQGQVMGAAMNVGGRHLSRDVVGQAGAVRTIPHRHTFRPLDFGWDESLFHPEWCEQFLLCQLGKRLPGHSRGNLGQQRISKV